MRSLLCIFLALLTCRVQLCVQKLRVFVDSQDQNLKYLGLLALGNVIKINPKAVSAHKFVVEIAAGC